MAEHFFCKQFIFSKFVGASRSASYTTIAMSPNLTEGDIKQIRKSFNGCRPDSPDLSTYQTSYAMSPVGDADLAFLRLDVIADAESGNKFILYERYIVISKEYLRKKNLKPLRLFRLLPTPEQIRENKVLEEFIDIERDLFDAYSFFQKEYPALLFSALYCLLISRYLLIYFRAGSIDWEWLTLLDGLVPNRYTMNLRVFLGVVKAKDWPADLEIRYSARFEQDIKIVAPIDVDFENFGEGFVDFLRRCVEANAINLFVEALIWSDTLNFDAFRDKNSSYDLLLKKEIPPDFILKLIRVEFKNRRNVTGELYWLWKNITFELDDIQKFLPLLLSTSVDKWSQKDFLILSQYIEMFDVTRVLHILESEEILNSVRIQFLMRWGQSVESLSLSERSLWVDLLVYLAKQEPSTSFGVFIQFLKFVDLGSFRDVKKIIKSFPKSADLKPTSNFWFFAAWLFSHVRQIKDLNTCVDVLSSVTMFPESYNLLEYLNRLLKLHKKDDSGIDVASRVVVEAHNAQVLSVFIPHIINITLISNNHDSLINLALSLKNIRTSLLTSYGFGNDALKPDANMLNLFYESVLVGSDEKYIAAYIFLLCRFSSKERVRDALSDVLIKSVDLFSRVVNFSFANLGMDTGCFAVSIPKFLDLKPEDQLRLLIVYFAILERLGMPFLKVYLLEKGLMNVTSLEFVHYDDLENFLSLLIKHNEWAMARMVLEHKVRASMVAKNKKATVVSLQKLFNVVSSERVASPKDLVKKRMVVSYLQELSGEPLNEFTDWLLYQPLSSAPLLKGVRWQPLTSSFIFKHEKWFTEDAFIRYCLFEELSTWEWQ